MRGRSIARRVVSRIPSEFRLLLLGVGAAAVLFGLLTLHELRRSRRAQEGALADSLTGLPNRQAFEERMAREWTRATRYNRDLGLLLLDLDGFKQVNDTHGHMAGDRLLREAGAAIASRVRESDVPARLGGDEFVVLCPETAGSGLEALASGLERTLAEHSVNASVGFAEREPGDLAATDLLGRADSSMYARKHVRREATTAGTEVLATA